MVTEISLGSLPQRLHVTGHDMVIQPFKMEQADEAYGLVCAEANLGQDVGMDQYGSKEHLSNHLKTFPSFGVSEAVIGRLYAFIVIGPSLYSRSTDTVLADGLIICDANVKSSILRKLVQATQSLSKDFGYEGLLVEAFRGSAFGPLLEAEGFTAIGCIPNSGKLMDKGWIESVIMYKDLQQFQIKTHSCKNNKKSLRRVLNDDWWPTQCLIQKPRLTYLPCRHTLPTGKEVIVRYSQEADIPHIYEMYKKSAEKFEGYASDEFESLEIFRFLVVDHAHSFIVEDQDTSTILTHMSIIPSMICQSVDQVNVDCYSVVNEKFRGMKIGLEGLRLSYRLILDLGYKAIMGDCLVANVHMLNILRKQGEVAVAQIPKAANGKDGKLQYTIVMYKDLGDNSKLIAKL